MLLRPAPAELAATCKHYESVAAGGAYESAVFYCPESGFMSWVAARCLTHIRPSEGGATPKQCPVSATVGADTVPKRDGRPRSRLVDIGGGTGSFTAVLARAAGILPGVGANDVRHHGDEPLVLCVDPCPEMVQRARSVKGVTALQDNALSFSQRRDIKRYDIALLKEVVHHLPAADLDQLYAGIWCQLSPGGVVCTITRPHNLGRDFPLFAACREIWRDNQGEAAVYESAVRRAGFVAVKTHEETFEFRVSKVTWLDMVRSRFWSTLSTEHFTNEELEVGVEELERRFAHHDEIVVRDKLIFLVGHKLPSGSGSGDTRDVGLTRTDQQKPPDTSVDTRHVGADSD